MRTFWGISTLQDAAAFLVFKVSQFPGMTTALDLEMSQS
jgi:hypothetical protein